MEKDYVLKEYYTDETLKSELARKYLSCRTGV